MLPHGVHVTMSLLPPDALAALPEPVTACPRCGSPAIRPAQAAEGAFAGGGELLGIHHCPKCGHTGPAMTFARRAEYARFVEGLRGA